MPNHILIVDDDQTIRTALTRWVQKQGWVPHEVGHAQDAIDLLTSVPIDLALVDVRMPDIDGLELSQHIIDQDVDIPIVLMTAYADLETARQALNIGVYEYFTKPLDFKDLQAGITRALQHRRLAQENRAHRAKLEQEVNERTQELTQINAQLQLEIEERKKVEDRLVQLERLGALAEMSEGVSHNLNNILTGILGPAQLIEMQSQDPNILGEARVIREAAMRAADLVKRLSISVRGESGERQAVNVDQTLHDAIQATQPRWKDEAEAQGIHIKVDVNQGSPPNIHGTVAGLHNILLNLILNAIDAMPEGGTLSFTTQTANDMVQITVSDTGIGMSDQIKRRVFEPFFTTKAEVGKGLGMAGVYTVVTRWGGHIELESTPQKGTTAMVHLPIWKDSHAQTEKSTPLSPRSGTILIVEDDDIVRTFLTRALSAHHQIDTVSNGMDALNIFSEKNYDVVMVDLGMPNLPGHQVIKQMRQVSPNISTILITGWHLSEEDPRYQAFDFHLQKPFESVQKISTVVAQAIHTYDSKQTATQ